jgi:transposase InsO family protein
MSDQPPSTTGIRPLQGSDRLTEKNYGDWAQHMEIVMEMADCWERVTTTEDPATTLTPGNSMKERTAKYLITGSIESDQRSHIRGKTGAKDIWNALKDVHQSGTTAYRSALKTELWSTRIKADEDIPVFLKTFKTKINDLENVGEKVASKERAFLLLGALSDEYRQIRLAVDAAESEPTFEKIEKMLMNDYTARAKSKNDAKIEESSIQGMTAKHNRPRKQKEKQLCDNCGLWVYHKGPDCWQLPENQHKRPENRKRKSDSDHQSGRTANHEFYALNAGVEKINHDGCEYCKISEKPLSECWAYQVETEEYMSKNGGTNNSEDWIVDTGASDHLCGNPNLFTRRWGSDTIKIKTGESDKLTSNEKGRIETFVGKHKIAFDAYYVPGLLSNLLSIRSLKKNNPTFQIELGKNSLKLILSPTFILEADVKDKLYVLSPKAYMSALTGKGIKRRDLPLESPDRIKKVKSTHPDAVEMEKWHRRLMHSNLHDIRKLLKRQVPGLKILDPLTDFGILDCECCIMGKHHTEASAKHRITRSLHPLELVYSDLAGPITLQKGLKARNNELYMISFIDDFSRYAVTHLLPSKCSTLVAASLTAFIKRAERESNRKMIAFQTDGGSEYRGMVDPILTDMGILHRITNPNKPYQNGVAERFNRTIFEGVRAMLRSQNVSPVYWGDAVLYCTIIKNHLPTKILKDITPFETYYKKAPDYSNFRVFGCSVYYKRVDHRTKLEDKSKIGIFIGLPKGSKGWMIHNLDTNRVTTSRDCVFLESADQIDATQCYESLSTPWKETEEGSSPYHLSHPQTSGE